MHEQLIQRVQHEADLCRNEGAIDIAKLLDEVERALSAAPSTPVAWMDPSQGLAPLAFIWAGMRSLGSEHTVPVFRLPAQLHLVGQIRGLTWEFQGVFSTPEAAAAACKTGAFFMYPITLDEELPTETVEIPADLVSWPRADLAGLETHFARSGAVHAVVAERLRQIEAEGWTPEHDDQHDLGELAAAAAAYALGSLSAAPPPFWPWDRRWWKPSDPRRNLVKAAPLMLAEIERLDRASAGEEQSP